MGYSSRPKPTKVGLCKELEGHVFDYGGHGAADTMRVTQEKIQQYVGITYGKDIANKIKNKILVVLSPSKYSDAIELRHIKYESLVRSKQTNMLMALQAKLNSLQAAAVEEDDVAFEVATLQNDIADIQCEIWQERGGNLGFS